MGIDLRGLFYFAMLGMISAAALLLGGVGWLVWFAINHIRIV